jgi:hypothetical protein
MADAAWRIEVVKQIEVVKRAAEAKGVEVIPDLGSSSAPSPASIAAGGSPRNTRTSIAPASLSSAAPASGSSSDGLSAIVIPRKLPGRILRPLFTKFEMETEIPVTIEEARKFYD